MDALSPDPVRARALEAGEIDARWTGAGKPEAIPAWSRIESVKDWLDRALKAASKAEPSVASAAEWLLDNAYQVQRAVLQLDEDLPHGFYERLRPLSNGPAKGEPLVLWIAFDLLQANHFQLSRQELLTYLQAYQEHNPLNIAELWALPSMLRLACLERLVSGFEMLFPAVPAPFKPSACCLHHRHDSDPAECVSRGVGNLGIIASIAWNDVFDATSLVEHKLAEDPKGIYSKMDFETRDSYRRRVERLAECSSTDELEVAAHAVTLAYGSERAMSDTGLSAVDRSSWKSKSEHGLRWARGWRADCCGTRARSIPSPCSCWGWPGSSCRRSISHRREQTRGNG